MKSRLVVLRCTGRQFDPRTGRPVVGDAGQPCGKTFTPAVKETQAAYEQRARVSGWRLGPMPDDGARHVICAAYSAEPMEDRIILAVSWGSGDPDDYLDPALDGVTWDQYPQAVA